MPFTIEEWALKMVRIRNGDWDLSNCEIVEDDVSYTLVYNHDHDEVYTLNKMEYMQLKEQLCSKINRDEVRFFYYFEKEEAEHLFVFEIMEHKDLVDYTFMLDESRNGKASFDLFNIEVNGDDEQTLNHFFQLYSTGLETLIQLKTLLYQWFSENKDYRLAYLLQSTQDDLFRYCDKSINDFLVWKKKHNI
jgi:hypothetical protein